MIKASFLALNMCRSSRLWHYQAKILCAQWLCVYNWW